MRIDPEDLRKHYASLSDGEFDALDRDDLVEVAQKIYDEERARREAARPQEAEGSAEAEYEAPPAADDAGDWDIDTGPPPWLQDAACAYSFEVHRQNPDTSDVAKASRVLRAARIPCYVVTESTEREDVDVCSLMVPGALALHATSVLDRDMFNAQQEEVWRANLETLSDGDLRALDPRIFCAGFLDRAARLRKAYEDEIARRNLKPRDRT